MRRGPVIALVAWTFLVWTTRIGNIWRDDALDTSGRVGRTALALSFTVLAALVVGALLRRPALVRPAVVALAGWTAAVWVVRDTSILVGDHDTAFKVVHTILAVISIALAAWAFRSLRSPASDRTPTPVS